MEPGQLENRMERIMEDLSRLAGDICMMKALDVRQYPKRYEEMSTQTALSAEKIACKLRSMVYATTQVPRHAYLLRASEAHGIDISETDGILQIVLPFLLPKKKSRQSSLFLEDPLHAALAEYVAENLRPHLQKSVVCFCHVYAWELPLRLIPDSDNLQQKQVLDLLSLFFLTDDNGMLCSTCTMAERGEHTHTRVYIMAKEKFPEWLSEYEKEHQNQPETV